MSNTEPKLPIIALDCEQYIAVLYDDKYGPHPTGMIGPSAEIRDVSAQALCWVHDGIEWGAKRRAQIVFMTNEPSVECDITIRAEASDG